MCRVEEADAGVPSAPLGALPVRMGVVGGSSNDFASMLSRFRSAAPPQVGSPASKNNRGFVN